MQTFFPSDGLVAVIIILSVLPTLSVPPALPLSEQATTENTLIAAAKTARIFFRIFIMLHSSDSCKNPFARFYFYRNRTVYDIFYRFRSVRAVYENVRPFRKF